MTNRIGILGGTFDPIHYGHLAIAEEARVALGLDRVLLIPAAQQPLKRHRAGASAEHRLAMVRLACDGNPAFQPSPIEITRAGVSYTVTTLEQLQREQPGELFFVLGADAVADLPRWHAAARVVELARIVVVGRPRASDDRQALLAALPALAGRLTELAGPGLDLSSSAIRQRVAGGLPIRYLTPDAVAQYIDWHRLYRDEAGRQGPAFT